MRLVDIFMIYIEITLISDICRWSEVEAGADKSIH